MSVQGKIKQYAIILDLLKDEKQKSFAQIKNKMEDEGFPLSDRTIRRVFEQLRTEYGIGIESKGAKYFINPEHSFTISSFLRLYQAVGLSEFVETVFNHKKKPLKNVDAENGNDLKGIHLLQPVFKAILHHKTVRFTHENFHHNTSKQYSVHPYMLKEYLSRWYIVGIVTVSGKTRTFGLDRITNFETLDEKFSPDNNFPYHDLFLDAIGLNFDTASPEEVIFSTTPLQAKYLKSLPLHHSQQVMHETPEGTTFSLHVVVNVELKQHLLRLTNDVTVISPISLKNELIAIYTAALTKYAD